MTTLTTPKPPTLHGALMLAGLGFKIFPASPNKNPMRGVKWKAEATSHPDTIAAWWQRYPHAAIGLPCGAMNGVTVIDIDTPQGHGELATGIESMRALKAALHFDTVTLMARTPSGGFHLFYRFDERIRNSANQIGAGLDVRGEGGYVVVAPSVTPRGAYTWLDARHKPSKAPDLTLISDLPPVFAQHIIEARHKTP